MAILIVYTMHLTAQFNHFNAGQTWVAVRCEVSKASEATPTVAEASKYMVKLMP